MDKSLLGLYNKNSFVEVIKLVTPLPKKSFSLEDYFLVLDATLEVSDLKKAKEIIASIQKRNLTVEQQLILTFYSCKLLFYEGYFQISLKNLSEITEKFEFICDKSLRFQIQVLHATLLYHNGKIEIFKKIIDKLRDECLSNDLFSVQINILQGYYCVLTGNLQSGIDLLKNELKNPLLLTKPLILARIYFLLGSLYLRLSEIQNAIKFGLQSEEIATTYKFNPILSEVFGLLASCYRENGNYNKAKDYVLNGININEKIGNQFDLGRNYGNLANIYAFEGKYSQAIENYLNSYEYFKNLNYGKYISFTLNNLGNIYRIQGNLQEAKKYYHESLDIMISFNDQQAIVSRYTNLGDVYYALQDLEESNNFYTKAFEFHLKSHNKYQILSILYKLLVVQKELGTTVTNNPLLKYLSHNEINLPSLEAKYLQIQSLISQENGNHLEAISLLQRAIEKPGVQFEEIMINYENIIINKILLLQNNQDLSIEAIERSGILSILSVMEKIAQEKQIFPNLCKIYLLMSKFYFLIGDYESKDKYNNLALEIANSKGLNLYYNLIKIDIAKIKESTELGPISQKETILQITDYIQFIGKKLNDLKLKEIKYK